MYTNPAEFLLDLVSSDFGGRSDTDGNRVERIKDAWAKKAESSSVESFQPFEKGKTITSASHRPGIIWITLSLLHRALIKSYRDVVAYGIRIVMYLGMYSDLVSWMKLIFDRSGDHDGHRVAPAGYNARPYPAIHQCYCKQSIKPSI